MYQVGLVVVSVVLGTALALNTNVEEAREWLQKHFEEVEMLKKSRAIQQWALKTPNNENKEQIQKDYDESLANIKPYNIKASEEGKAFDWKSFQDEDVKRKYLIWSDYGDDLLPGDVGNRLNKVIEDMKNAISKTFRVKPFDSPNGTPELNNVEMLKKIKENDKNFEALKYYWQEYFNKVGRQEKDLFTQWIQLKTQSAKTNGFENAPILEYWQTNMEVKDYESTTIPLLQEIKPLFTELHAYIRHKLHEIYGEAINPTKPIPANVVDFGWKDEMPSVYDKLIPYPGKKRWDITPGLKDKDIKGRRMVEMVDKFYQSLGFDKLPDDFYENSFFEKQDGLDCEKGVYNLREHHYRLKVCTEPTKESLDDVMNVVVLTEYELAFEHQPVWYRLQSLGPLDASLFEVVRKFISKTPNHLKSLGLIDKNFQVDRELEINLLMDEALRSLWFMPMYVAFDQWRWRVIKGEVKPDNYNCEFWKLRTQYQGVEPPVDRSDEDFDPGTFIWGLKGEQWIKTFMYVLNQYSLLKGLCDTAGKHPDGNPENDYIFCDISGNRDAGGKLKTVYSLGASLPWYEIIGKITGKNGLDTTGIKEYFDPLIKWLKEYNDKHNVERGWPEQQTKCH